MFGLYLMYYIFVHIYCILLDELMILKIIPNSSYKWFNGEPGKGFDHTAEVNSRVQSLKSVYTSGF